MQIGFHRPCLFVRKAGGFISASPSTVRLLLSLAVIVAAGVCLAGCTGPHTGGEMDAGGAERIDYRDGLNRVVRLPRHPVRIISLAPSVTETLFMVGAADRLIGVTLQCDWPEEARSKPRIGELLNPNFEAVLAARPDLVIASTAGNDRAAVLKLAGLGVPVFVTAPRNVEGIFKAVLDIGAITGCAARAAELAGSMRSRLERVKRRLAGVPPTKALYITWFDPLLVPGKNTFESDLLALVGVQSITSGIDEFYPRYSLEQVILNDPDTIISVVHQVNPIPDLARTAGWQTLRAVQAGRIILLSDVIQHPSPRFVDGVEELARKLHPELFP